MTQAVLDIKRVELDGITHVIGGRVDRIKLKAPSREIITLGVFLCILQVVDGVLTSLGVGAFGVSAEGNAFLRFLMEQMGHIPALILTKSLAVFVTFVLCLLSSSVSWVSHALKCVIGVYLLAAIVPWTLILLSDRL